LFVDISIFSNPKNWIVSKIEKENKDKDDFCKSVGLPSDEAKFIHVPSGFPLQNRPIYPLDVAYFNYEVNDVVANLRPRKNTMHISLR
jgi:hypothetical protein